MTAGVPGGDPETAESGGVGHGVDELIIRYFVALVRALAYIVFPPLKLYSDPIRGFWRWRKIYLVYLVGDALVFLPSVMTGDLRPLVLFPVFHLILFALLAELTVAIVAPSLVASMPTLSIPVSMPVLAGAAAVLVLLAVMLRGVSVPLPSIPAVSWPFGETEPEYDIEMTEVWKSGGKHE